MIFKLFVWYLCNVYFMYSRSTFIQIVTLSFQQQLDKICLPRNCYTILERYLTALTLCDLFNQSPQEKTTA